MKTLLELHWMKRDIIYQDDTLFSSSCCYKW